MLEHSCNLLYVDDEKDNLIVFRSTFRRYYNVFTAESAEQGLSILDDNDIHVIVTDQRMPERTGLEFLELTMTEHPDVIKIILTGFSDIEVIIQAVNKINLFGYVQKPWDKDYLKKTIDNGFESFQLKRQNKALVDDLQVALAELNTFLYRASHDLRGPITRMIGLAQVAKMEDIDNTATDYFDRFELTALGLQRVLDKLVVMKTINEQSSTIDKINFEEIYKRLKRRLAAEIKDADIQVSFQQDPEVNLYSNPELIEVLVGYLFENAVQFADEEKKNKLIEIFIKKVDKEVSLTVKDNGIGIGNVHKGKVFDMFYRGTDKADGSGLGLYISRRIIAKLDGQVNIASEAGVGTEITIKLPAK